MSPLLLDGPAALSVFALAKVQAEEPAIVYAEFVHLLELGEPLNDAQLVQVQQLLNYGPTLELPPKQAALDHRPRAAPFHRGRVRPAIFSRAAVSIVCIAWSEVCDGTRQREPTFPLWI